jgi:hypothetical protein
MNKNYIYKTMEELTLTEISIESNKKKHQEKEDAKNKKLADIAEEKRMREILVPYLDKLQDNLEEKDLLSFWIFSNESGFVKHKNLQHNMLKNLIKSNPNKYKNSLVSNVRICFYHNKPLSSVFRELKIYMVTEIEVYSVDKDGNFNGDKSPWGATIAWHAKDFKITKFSLKLMQVIHKQIVKKIYLGISLVGYPLTNVIKTLEKKGVDFQNTLSPLAGAIKK